MLDGWYGNAVHRGPKKFRLKNNTIEQFQFHLRSGLLWWCSEQSWKYKSSALLTVMTYVHVMGKQATKVVLILFSFLLTSVICSCLVITYIKCLYTSAVHKNTVLLYHIQYLWPIYSLSKCANLCAFTWEMFPWDYSTVMLIIWCVNITASYYPDKCSSSYIERIQLLTLIIYIHTRVWKLATLPS